VTTGGNSRKWRMLHKKEIVDLHGALHVVH
jgi:hypothetical protein